MSFGNPNILFSSGTNLQTTPEKPPPGAPGLPNGSVPVVTLPTPGPPTTGVWIATQAVIDSNGQTWICTESGTPGTWTRVGVVSFNGRSGPVIPVEGDYAGNLLGKLIYAPTTAETFNVATAGFAALTPAQAVTFNAPSSGAVTVALSADVVIPNGATAGSGLFWALFSGGAQIGPVTAALSLSAAATAAIGVVVTQTIELTGLTAGQQYTLDWAAYSPQTFTMQAGTGAGVADAPPLSMRVLAA